MLFNLNQISNLLQGTILYNNGCWTKFQGGRRETLVRIKCRMCGKEYLSRPRDVLSKGLHHSCEGGTVNVRKIIR